MELFALLQSEDSQPVLEAFKAHVLAKYVDDVMVAEAAGCADKRRLSQFAVTTIYAVSAVQNAARDAGWLRRQAQSIDSGLTESALARVSFTLSKAKRLLFKKELEGLISGALELHASYLDRP